MCFIYISRIIYFNLRSPDATSTLIKRTLHASFAVNGNMECSQTNIYKYAIMMWIWGCSFTKPYIYILIHIDQHEFLPSLLYKNQPSAVHICGWCGFDVGRICARQQTVCVCVCSFYICELCNKLHFAMNPPIWVGAELPSEFAMAAPIPIYSSCFTAKLARFGSEQNLAFLGKWIHSMLETWIFIHGNQITCAFYHMNKPQLRHV